MMCWASCAIGAAPAAASSWDDLVAAAQREGRLVVAGPAHPEVRQALPAAFKARFGINLEYIGGPASAAVAKLHAERLAGIYSLDVTLAEPDGTHIRSVLGMDVLRHYCCRFRLDACALDVETSPSELADQDLLMSQLGHVYVDVHWPGVTAHACWDSGADRDIEVHVCNHFL